MCFDFDEWKRSVMDDFDDIEKMLLDFVDNLSAEQYDDLVYRKIDDDMDFLDEDRDDSLDDIDGIYDIGRGISKTMLAFSAYPDLAFKIPARGVELYETSWTSDDDGFSELEYEFKERKEFKVPRIGKTSFLDYCDKEEFVWKRLKDTDMASVVVPTMYLGDFWGIDVYVSPYMPQEFCLDWDRSDEHAEDAVKVSTSVHGKIDVEQDTLAQLCSFFGVDVMTKFFDTMNAMGIADFHDGNFMCDEDDVPRCIDYSGFVGMYV